MIWITKYNDDEKLIIIEDDFKIYSRFRCI